MALKQHLGHPSGGNSDSISGVQLSTEVLSFGGKAQRTLNQTQSLLLGKNLEFLKNCDAKQA